MPHNLTIGSPTGSSPTEKDGFFYVILAFMRDDSPADERLDLETRARLRAIVADIFTRHGGNGSTLHRANGWTNSTWLAGDLALRLSTLSGTDRLRREARLVRLLPREVGYPPVVDTGVTQGHEWSLTRMVHGRNLGEVWPELDWETRISALEQLWQKAAAVHTVPIEKAAGLALDQPWFNAPTLEASQARLESLAAQGILAASQVNALVALLERFWQVRPSASCVLNHGDWTIENAIWRDGQVVSLLDFEFAVIAPVEVDLVELIKVAFTDAESPFPDPGGAGMKRLRQAVSAIARPLLAHPYAWELLTGYAILLEQWMMEEYLRHPEGEGPLELYGAYHNLVSLAGGQSSFFAPLFA